MEGRHRLRWPTGSNRRSVCRATLRGVFAGADVFNVRGDLAAVAAAAAALVTVTYARSTVLEARESRREAEEMHGEDLAAQRQLLASAATAHESEMAERRKALDAEITLQRLRQVGVVADLVGQVADIARAEAAEPPPMVEGAIFPLTRVPGALAKLSAALVILESLGGPQLIASENLARGGSAAGTPPMRVLGEATKALSELHSLIRNDESLQLTAPPDER